MEGKYRNLGQRKEADGLRSATRINHVLDNQIKKELLSQIELRIDDSQIEQRYGKKIP